MYVFYVEYWLGEFYMVLKFVSIEKFKWYFINFFVGYLGYVKVLDVMFKLGKLYVG